MSDTTVLPESLRDTQSETAPPTVWALCIAWSRTEPEKIGAIAIVPREGGEMVLGRGDDPREPRVTFFAQRPSRLDPVSPFAAASLSRRQLLVRGTRDGVHVEAVGKNPLRVNAQLTSHAILRAGDTVTLEPELVLLCVERPATFPVVRHFPMTSAGQFGGADAFGVIGESATIWRVREQIAFAAASDAHVLVVGPSGTGKELAAQAVHRLSTRASGAFVARNAATFPSALMDAELFGNARNYPNAGMPERPGLVGQADGGTLFLDEIGELAPELQAHLLRVMDARGEYQRLGEAAVRRSNLRLVAATNRDPSTLKHDFLARFRARIELPPLEQRREDIALLVRDALLRAAEHTPAVAGRFVELSAGSVRVKGRLVETLLRRSYATHVREVQALLWEAMAESAGDTVDVPASLHAHASSFTRPPAPVGEPTVEAIKDALAIEPNATRAAKRLGLSSRFALYRLMQKHGLQRDPAGE